MAIFPALSGKISGIGWRSFRASQVWFLNEIGKSSEFFPNACNTKQFFALARSSISDGFINLVVKSIQKGAVFPAKGGKKSGKSLRDLFRRVGWMNRNPQEDFNNLFIYENTYLSYTFLRAYLFENFPYLDLIESIKQRYARRKVAEFPVRGRKDASQPGGFFSRINWKSLFAYPGLITPNSVSYKSQFNYGF